MHTALPPSRSIGSGIRLSVLTVIVLAALPTLASAQWQWRDSKGQVNASDRPPPRDVPDKDIISRPAPENRRVARAAEPAASAAPSGAPAVAASAPATALEREVQARRRAAEQEQAVKSRAEEERRNVLRAENCRAARSHLLALDSGQRIARTNEKGEREVLDDKGRAEEQRRAREVVAADCR